MLVAIPFIARTAKDYVGYIIFIECVVLLPLLILTSKDCLNSLNKIHHKSLFIRILVRAISSIQVLIFGIISLIFGISIIAWVLYNYLYELQPQFTGGEYFTGFGIGPALIVFGLHCLRSVFFKSKLPENNIGIEHEDEENT